MAIFYFLYTKKYYDISIMLVSFLKKDNVS